MLKELKKVIVVRAEDWAEREKKALARIQEEKDGPWKLAGQIKELGNISSGHTEASTSELKDLKKIIPVEIEESIQELSVVNLKLNLDKARIDLQDYGENNEGSEHSSLRSVSAIITPAQIATDIKNRLESEKMGEVEDFSCNIELEDSDSSEKSLTLEAERNIYREELHAKMCLLSTHDLMLGSNIASMAAQRAQRKEEETFGSDNDS